MSDPADLKDQIQLFLLDHPASILRDPRFGMKQVAEYRFSLEVLHGKLYLTLWNSELSISRRIVEVVCNEKDRLVLRVTSGFTPPFDLEFDARVCSGSLLERRKARFEFRRQMLDMLRKCFPRLHVQKLVGAKDLSRSLSEHYIRGVGREKNRYWALFGVNPIEDQAAVDASLSFSVIWWNELNSGRLSGLLSGLKLFAPTGRCTTLATRLGNLRPEGPRVDLFEYDENIEIANQIDPTDFGNLDTRLSQVDRVPLPLEGIPIDFLPPEIRSHVDVFEVVHQPASHVFSIRFRGLEFARLSEEREPKLRFGVGAMDTAYAAERDEELGRLIADMLSIRRVDSRLREHPYFRLQSERWLEALVLKDIRHIRADLDPQFVYPQVPAFSGLDRGVIDVLSITQERQLAVVELKVAEDINLPLQALDYWMRVKWHHERGDFKRQGYFAGIDIAPRAPVLFLVCPAFRFHSTTEDILKFFPREMEVIKVGINENWRAGIQVLYRRRV